MHSNASCDSRATMAEMCESALSQGIAEIAFTEHFDLKPEDVCAGFYKPEVYFEKLEAARAEFAPRGMTIRAGVEIGEYHRFRAEIQPVLDAWPYDYVLGSLHWVGEWSVFDVEFYRNFAPEEAIVGYFRELTDMIHVGGFDVLAHADIIKRTAHTVYQHFDSTDWEDIIRMVWRACIDKGIGIEINSSGLRLSVGQTHPSLDALRWYREMGGELLTIGSDSHRPDQVGVGLHTALDQARAAGFTRVCSFENRQVARWIPI
jgi:histidinol-phosphatase (PHP family)